MWGLGFRIEMLSAKKETLMREGFGLNSEGKSWRDVICQAKKEMSRLGLRDKSSGTDCGNLPHEEKHVEVSL